MKKYLAECIGTFVLVFCGTGAIVVNEITMGAVSHVGISMVFGLIVMVMIYVFGDISGAHLNPAVSFAFWTRGKLTLQEFSSYSVSQVVGALLASGVLKLLFPASTKLGATIPLGPELSSFVLEILLAFFLLFTIGIMASRKNSALPGLVIGSVILLEALLAGPISGASMNPARSLSPALVSGNMQNVWIYLTAPFIGAFIGIKTAEIFED